MKQMDFSKVLGFLKGLAKKDKILVVYHRDADGLCSAVITREALARIGLESDLMVTHLEETPELKSLPLTKYNILIFLDLALDHLKGRFWNVDQKVLIVDHHPFHSNLNSKQVVHFNNHFFNEKYQPVSYLSYKIFSELADLKDIEWISVLGTIADYGYDDCKDLLDKYIKVKEKKEMFDTKYGKAAGMISGDSFFLGFDNMAEILIESGNVDEFLSNKKIGVYYEKYMEEVERLKKEFWKTAEKEGNAYFAHIESKIDRIQSPLLTQISSENPDKIMIVYHKVDGNFKISGRAQTGYDLGEIFMKAAEFAGGSGGGHKPAAGALVPAASFDKFKKKVIEMVSG